MRHLSLELLMKLFDFFEKNVTFPKKKRIIKQKNHGQKNCLQRHNNKC